MNVFAKFDEILSMILQDIKETKSYGHTFFRTDNVKTVYPPTNTVWGGGGGGGGGVGGYKYTPKSAVVFSLYWHSQNMADYIVVL